MAILVLNQLMILLGISAAIYSGAAKIALFSVALCCGLGLYVSLKTGEIKSESNSKLKPLPVVLQLQAMVYNRFRAFILESKGEVRSLIYTIAILFFSSWLIFPIAFALGPTGMKLFRYG